MIKSTLDNELRKQKKTPNTFMFFFLSEIHFLYIRDNQREIKLHTRPIIKGVLWLTRDERIL